jgi:transcriptional regulator with GAF, ATPase, and Fis domain
VHKTIDFYPTSQDADVPIDPHELLRMFRAVFDATPYGVLVATEEGTILFANAAASSIFAFPPDELIGQPISRLLPQAPTGSRRLASGTRKDGTPVRLELDVNVVTQDQARLVIVSMFNVTGQSEIENRPAAAASEHLALHRLVGDIAARFGAVPLDAIDEAIRDSLRQLGESLRLDRTILWRRRPDEAEVKATHVWTKDAGEKAPAPLPLAAAPYLFSRLTVGEPCWFTRLDEVPNPSDRDTFRIRGAQSAAVFPIAYSGQAEGTLEGLAFVSTTRAQEWAPAILERLRLVAGVIGQAFARTRSQLALQTALDEIRTLRDRVGAENVELRREVRGLHKPGIVVADSSPMKRVLSQIEQVAPTPATVLLLGETGTGKEVMAQAIHNLSPRHQRQMIRVSCAAIPTALIESELFGRERGAYTGALSRQIGRFEAANQSTLFLDEIGELPAEVQVKLLRVLQERVFERLGSTQSIKVDVRIIAATNRNLEDAVGHKTFREDLFYRLNVFPVVVPPLRERADDIPGLVWSFVDEFSRTFGKNIESISRDSMRDLQRYAWPGNVRELRNVIERAVIISPGPQLLVAAPRPATRVPTIAMTLTDLESEHIRSVLESTNWRVRGAGGAAERLGLKPTTLESRMARLGIVRKRPS